MKTMIAILIVLVVVFFLATCTLAGIVWKQADKINGMKTSMPKKRTVDHGDSL